TLESHGIALAQRGEHRRMREVCEDGLAQSRRIHAEGSARRLPVQEYEVTFLNNLGTAEFRLGLDTAREHHEQANLLAEAIGYEYGAAIATRSLAADYLALERYTDGLDYYVKALRRYEKLGRTARIEQLTAQLRQLRSLADSILKEMSPDEH